METVTAGKTRGRGFWRAVMGAAAALAVLAVALGITLIGTAQDPARAHMVAATRPSQPTAATTTSSSSSSSSSGTTTAATTPPTTTTAPPPPSPPTTQPTMVGATVVPPAGPPRPTVALTGPTLVEPGGSFQWHSRVTGAVSGTWSGSVLDAERGPGATVAWSAPAGLFYWNDPSTRLEGATYTITLTVYNAAGQSAQATAAVDLP